MRERKVITVLFADLVGFTSTAEQLDPEDVEEILRPYHEGLRSELERWGGTVEKFIGDAVVALFGAPVAREDDPERAIRAALAIRDWIVDEGKLEVRIAVNTGEALVTLDARPEAGEGMAAGDVVNTTARLQSAAPVNGILVGETTYRATAQTIDYRDHPRVEAKGKAEPIPVWEVVQARARFGADLAPTARAPLIGRERELEQLTDALRRAAAQRSTELVTLVGVAGMGKSRLVGELFAAVEQRDTGLVYWRQGRSLPYGEGVSFWALAEMIKAHAGILESDSDDEVEAKLERVLEGLDDAEWVRAHLRPLAGQAELATGSRDEAFAAWRRFLESIADEYPLVLVFEDLQWADDGLLDFIEYLVDWVKGVPLLIVCTARLELMERRPAWGGGKLNSRTMALAPLSAEQTAHLLSALSDRPLVEAETQAALLERAGGNPLYAEQYVRMLAERETLDELPESVQGIIAARLDALPADEKRLLQDAAVVGKVFWLGAVGATEHDVHPLEQKDLVQRARRSSLDGEMEFSFRHVLVRDVAYGQIPRRDRAEKHVRVAGWIESLPRRDDLADFLAHHYVQALQLARSDDRELAARARAALEVAGDRAMSLFAYRQAEDYFRQALDLEHDARVLLKHGRCLHLGNDPRAAQQLAEARDLLEQAGDRETAAEAALLLADIGWRRGDSKEQMAHVEDARRLLAGAARGPAYASVLSQLARYAMLVQSDEEALRYGAEALELAETLGLDDLRADVLVTRATVRANAGDRGGFDDINEAIRIATEKHLPPQLLRAYNNLIALDVIHGDVAAARTVEAEMFRLGEQYGERTTTSFGEGTRVANAVLVGDWDEAAESIERFLTDDARYQAATVTAFKGWLKLARFGPDGVAADAEAALRRVESIRDPQALQTVRSMTSSLLLECGEAERAERVVRESLPLVRATSPLGFVAIELHHLAHAARRLGYADELLAAVAAEPFQSLWLQAATAIANGDDARGAELLEAAGAPAYAAYHRLHAGTEADLRRAIDFYRTVGAAWFIERAQAQLPASA